MPRILVVDDEPDIATVIQRALETSGFQVDAFNKPEEALSNFKAGTYDMLITDIRMPVMNGFELYRQVKKIDDNIKVAFMTAFEVHQDEFRKMFPSTEVRCFIKKPVHMSDLAGRVKEELAIA